MTAPAAVDRSPEEVARVARIEQQLTHPYAAYSLSSDLQWLLDGWRAERTAREKAEAERDEARSALHAAKFANSTITAAAHIAAQRAEAAEAALTTARADGFAEGVRAAAEVAAGTTIDGEAFDRQSGEFIATKIAALTPAQVNKSPDFEHDREDALK